MTTAALVQDSTDPIAEWRELGANLPSTTIRVILADVDGVITPGEGSPAELRVLETLTKLNKKARRDPMIPAITLCTGRPAPYVEMMAQMTGVFLPCIFEHGSGLFLPKQFRYVFHPSLGQTYWANLARARVAFDEPLWRPGKAFPQPGKEASMSIYPMGGTPLDEVERKAQAALECEGLDTCYTLAANVNGVELRPTGIDKGAGTRWLAEEIGIPLERFGGMGDSDPDIAFLEMVAISAAPCNATGPVQQAVDIVTKSGPGVGLLEFIQRVIADNRRSAARS